MTDQKRITTIIATGALLGLAGYFFLRSNNFFQKPATAINSFEECAVAGFPIMESYPEQCRTPDGRTFVHDITSQKAAFGSPVTLTMNEQVQFTDGLSVTLLEINDSRCKPRMVCIWAGELSLLFRITGGTAGKSQKEIRLGTATMKSATENGYTFTLQDATETSAIIVVTKKESPAPTPTPTPSGEEIIKKVGEQESSFLIQKITRDSVEGLWFQVYPVARVEEGTPKTLRIEDDIGYACEGVSEKLIRIDFFGQTVTFNKVVGKEPMGGCPICLAGDTLIDTPSGSVAVKDVRVGMQIFTLNTAGKRISGVVIKTSKVPVSPTHRMIHLVLSDGRELFVSPGHPTTLGRTVGDLKPGSLYDGASVVATERVSYSEGATYDVLPSGETGFYFANGVLLGSTLRSE